MDVHNITEWARSGGAGAAPVPGRAATLAGRAAWLITDGHAGNKAQCEGLSAALGMVAEHKQVRPGIPWRWLAPWGPADPGARIGKPGGAFAPPWPALAIATGRQSIPFVRAVRGASRGQTFTVVIHDPRTGFDCADVICAPLHDGLAGPNVIGAATPPHPFSPRRLAALRKSAPPDIARLPAPRVAVLLGGPNAAYRFGPASLTGLTGPLSDLARLGASFLVTPSRRTPPHAVEAVAAATQGAPRLLWDGQGDNPYAHFLAHADMLIVTADSVNITSEACATGRPVHVFEPDGGSAKFALFHATLRGLGATRPLPARFERVEEWRYPPIDATGDLAAEIERRWRARPASGASEAG